MARRTKREQIFARAVRCCPDDVAARCRLAECLWERGSHQTAIEHLSQAVRLSDASDASMLVQLGQMHLAVNDLRAAEAMTESALHASPQDASAWRLRGAVMQRQGRAEDALDSYYRSLSYDPQNAETLLALAALHQEQARPSRALATLDRLDSHFVQSPAGERVWLLRGLAQKDLGRHHESLESLTRAAQRNTPSAELLGHLAQVQWSVGQQEAAEQTLRDAFVRATPEQQATLRQLMRQIAQVPTGPAPNVVR